MELQLNKGTKVAFESIISGFSLIKINRVFKKMMKEGGPLSVSDFAEIINVSESDTYHDFTSW